MVEEQCQQQLHEGLIENIARYSEGSSESSAISAIICPWENNSPMLTNGGSGKEVGEEPQKLILQPIPINLDPSATAKPKNSPLPVHILPTPTPYATLETPTAKAIQSPLPMLQNFRKLVVSIQTFATTSKTFAATHVAWHSEWLWCWFRFRAPEPQHFYKLH